MSLAEDFFELFQGLKRAHGRFEISKIQNKQKIEGSVSLIRSPTTVNHWDSHLNGEYGLGIVPIRDDGTVRFGCIDVDDYNVDHQHLENEILHLKLPLIVCRSKSGGAHLYLFLSEDIDAEVVRGQLMN